MLPSNRGAQTLVNEYDDVPSYCSFRVVGGRFMLLIFNHLGGGIAITLYDLYCLVFVTAVTVTAVALKVDLTLVHSVDVDETLSP